MRRGLGSMAEAERVRATAGMLVWIVRLVLVVATLVLLRYGAQLLAEEADQDERELQVLSVGCVGRAGDRAAGRGHVRDGGPFPVPSSAVRLGEAAGRVVDPWFLRSIQL